MKTGALIGASTIVGGLALVGAVVIGLVIYGLVSGQLEWDHDRPMRWEDLPLTQAAQRVDIPADDGAEEERAGEE